MEEQFEDWVNRQTKEGFAIVITPWDTGAPALAHQKGVIMSQARILGNGGLEVVVSVGESTVARAFKKLKEEIEHPFTHAKKPLDPAPVEKPAEPNAP